VKKLFKIIVLTIVTFFIMGLTPVDRYLIDDTTGAVQSAEDKQEHKINNPRGWTIVDPLHYVYYTDDRCINVEEGRRVAEIWFRVTNHTTGAGTWMWAVLLKTDLQVGGYPVLWGTTTTKEAAFKRANDILFGSYWM